MKVRINIYIIASYNALRNISLIALDMDAYAAKYGNRAVKKTLTIPAWLNTFVEKNGISCSKVLQEALCKMTQVK